MKRMSNSTIKIYNVMVREFAKRGFVPTIRQLIKLSGLKSTSTIAYHMEILEKIGWIAGREHGSARHYRLNRPTERGLSAEQVRELLDVPVPKRKKLWKGSRHARI